jgi:hypothetical protein
MVEAPLVLLRANARQGYGFGEEGELVKFEHFRPSARFGTNSPKSVSESAIVSQFGVLLQFNLLGKARQKGHRPEREISRLGPKNGPKSGLPCWAS